MEAGPYMTVHRSLGHLTLTGRSELGVQGGGSTNKGHFQGRKAGQMSPFPVLWVVICEQWDKRRDRGMQSIWDLGPTLGLTLAQVHCVLLGKFLPISGPQFSHLSNKN